MSSGGFWPGDPPATEEEDSGLRVPGWPVPRPEIDATGADPGAAAAVEEREPAPESEPAEQQEPEPAEQREPPPESEAAEPQEPEPDEQPEPEPQPEAASVVHASGELDIPDDVGVLEGSPSGAERTVGIVVSRFNGELTNRLLESALGALDDAGVAKERITVMPVPGAFELPIGAMALAKTRRYSCVIALGCVVRGETPHFDFVAGEAASGLQLAGLETGVPVAFGVLTVDTVEQANARTGKGAEAARTALEMADLFAQVRARAKSG